MEVREFVLGIKLRIASVCVCTETTYGNMLVSVSMQCSLSLMRDGVCSETGEINAIHRFSACAGSLRDMHKENIEQFEWIVLSAQFIIVDLASAEYWMFNSYFRSVGFEML